jgi:hypothetical protein
MAQFFPWPFWSDPARPSAYQVGDADRSLLAKVPRLKREGSTPRLTEPGWMCPRPASSQRSVTPFWCPSLTPPLTPSILVWSPSQPEPRAICADPPRTSFISARFLAIVTGQSQHDEILFQEDGWSVMTAPMTGDALLRHLASGQGIEVQAGRRVIVNVVR